MKQFQIYVALKLYLDNVSKFEINNREMLILTAVSTMEQSHDFHNTMFLI